MKILEKLTKKIASSASVAVTDSVKTEAKKVVKDASPVAVGIGAVILGLIIFKTASSVKGSPISLTPSASRIDVTTNNYFFDPTVAAEFVAKMINK